MLDIHVFEHNLLTNKQRQWEVSEEEGGMAPWTVTPSHCSRGPQTASSAAAVLGEPDCRAGLKALQETALLP